MNLILKKIIIGFHNEKCNKIALLLLIKNTTTLNAYENLKTYYPSSMKQ